MLKGYLKEWDNDYIRRHRANTEIQMKYVILNGPPHPETIKQYVKDGWVTICQGMAHEFHPYAAETDTILFLAKPINKELYDKEMSRQKKILDMLNGIISYNKSFYFKEEDNCENNS